MSTWQIWPLRLQIYTCEVCLLLRKSMWKCPRQSMHITRDPLDHCAVTAELCDALTSVVDSQRGWQVLRSRSGQTHKSLLAVFSESYSTSLCLNFPICQICYDFLVRFCNTKWYKKEHTNVSDGGQVSIYLKAREKYRNTGNFYVRPFITGMVHLYYTHKHIAINIT